MLISSRKISIPCVADAIIPKFWPGIKKIIIFTPKMRFLGKNWMAGLTRLKFLSQINQNICTKMTKRASLSVKLFMVKWLFEITKYLKRVTWAIQNICGSTVWFNIQLVPKTYFGIFVIYFCRVIRNQRYTESESDQIFVIWRKWGARYTFWYIVRSTLCNALQNVNRTMGIDA